MGHKLEGWKFPTESEAKMMLPAELRQEISFAEQELSRLREILESTKE